MISVAKRENNKKRGFLLVNRFQAKHIATEPEKALGLFSELGQKVKEAYKDEEKERILTIGFAETATAIGAAVSACLGSYYIQTTREDIEGAEYLFFSEEHSHATEQRLVRGGLDKLEKNIDRIIFVDDEITTGRTILNIINVIKREYGRELRFTAASLINGMSAENKKIYEDENIDLIYLIETENNGFEEKAEAYRSDGRYIPPDTLPHGSPVIYIDESGRLPDARELVSAVRYDRVCREVCAEIAGRIDGTDILVLGTEECMYPAILTADELVKKGAKAVSHSTTRSPISVSAEESYPLHARYELPSFYDGGRITFIYDLKKYGAAVIITDSKRIPEKAENALINALRSVGNDNFYLVRL